MDQLFVNIFLFGGALLLLISGMPIWAGLAGISLLSMIVFVPYILPTMPYVLYSSLDNFGLLAIPLYVLLSAPIAASKAGRDLYETMHKWMYKIPGGLGIANMMSCGVFAALSGSSPATAAAIGSVGIPEMRRKGYSPALACGLIAHAGTFGILIPPSVTMILYGVATETSIGKCFIAGIFPGLLEILLSCIWVAGVFFYRKKHPAQKGSVYYIEDLGEIEAFSWKDRFHSLFKVAPFILIIVMIMITLYGGWATPSEAGGVGAVLSFIFVISIYKVFNPRKLWDIIIKALDDSAMILMIMAGALLFGYISSHLRVTQSIAEWILALPFGKWGIIFMINILLLVLGFFIPPAAVLVMVAPMLLPVVTGLGFDPVWFAVIATVNLEIGLVTPPVGVNLYVVKSIAPDVPMSTVLKGVYPFLVIEVIVIVAVCVFPELATWLPDQMIGVD